MKNTVPSASVIVSSYNHENYIYDALQSIKSSIEKSIEIVIVDDSSKDNSKELIEKWKDKNKNRFAGIKCIFHKKQYGISNVILELINASRASLIIPLASDDMYFPETVDGRIKFLNDNPDIWVGFSDASVVNESGAPIIGSLYKYYRQKFADQSCAVLKKELILNWNYPANIQFWRKGDWIHEISPGMFSEDIEIALAALSKNKVKYLNKVLYMYRCATWPIEAKGCEKSKRLHMSYYYRKAAIGAKGVARLAFFALSRYNLSLAVGDKTKAKKEEKKLAFLKKVPPLLF